MHRKGRLFVIMTILLVFIILFCSTEIVMSKSCRSDMRRKQYYAKMEKEYVSDIRTLLCKKGYSYSGITIRRISDAEGARSYTVMIHHKKINSLSKYEKEELLYELSVTEFEDEGCTFSYEFVTA